LETDSLPSALVFVVSLLLFSYLSLAHHIRAAPTDRFGAHQRHDHSLFVLSWLRHGSVIAVAISGLALVHSTGTVQWWPAALLALGLLVFLAGADLALARITSRRPGWRFFWRRSIPRFFSRTSTEGFPANRDELASSNANGGDELTLEDHPLPMQPVISPAELGTLDDRDREMLRSIVRLDVMTAREIMIPRLDIAAVEVDAGIVQVAELMIEGGHSRLPVYEESIDHILGIVHSREVLATLVQGDQQKTLRELVRPAFMIPETKRLDDLLEELQEKGNQMAIIVDEYGGTEGLLTIEDVLEEIVGEIEDEFSRTNESQIISLSDGAVLVDAGVTTQEVEELFATRLDSPDVDTVGGYVYQSLGKIPQAGDVVVTDHLRIEVVSILGRRLRKLRITPSSSNGATSAG
jgi:Mg2+/Co2+ transporter CorC